jgi:arylsulfatase A-like enzyme
MFAAVLCAAATLATCTRAPAPPNVVFVVIDTLRADHLGSYGYAKAQTPRFDALARAGTQFSAARAPTSWTLPSVASLLTGRYPGEHGVERLKTIIDEKTVTLPEALKGVGYATAAFSANVAVVIASAGFAQGFDSFEVLEVPLAPGEVSDDPIVVRDGTGRRTQAATANTVTDAALAWLGKRADKTAPYFMYVHYYDPHTSYAPPREYAERFGIAADDPMVGPARAMVMAGPAPPTGRNLEKLIALYDGEIAFTDTEVGRLIDGARADGSDPLVIVTSDHGEEFGEHGGMQHGRTLFEEVLHVPLIVAGAGTAPGRVVETPMSIVSLPLTIAELAHAELPGPFSVPSLVETLRGGQPAAQPVYAELAWGRGIHHWTGIDGLWKLVVDAKLRSVLYDLATDPGERTERQANEPGRTQAMRDRVDAHVKASAKVRTTQPPGLRELDAQQEKRLRALGYIQ